MACLLTVRSLFVQGVFYLLTFVTLYLSSPYFLISYFSVWDGETLYEGPFQAPISSGSFLMSLKSVTSQSTVIKDNALDIVLSTAITTDIIGIDINTNTSLCPQYFRLFIPGERMGCVQWQQEQLTYIAFSSDFDDFSPANRTSFAESPEDIINFGFNFNTTEGHYNAVNVSISLMQFQPGTESCRSDSDCSAYIPYLKGSGLPFAYNYNSLRCYGSSNSIYSGWISHGCAVEIVQGLSESNCLDDKGILTCPFVSFYSMFIEPPKAFTVAGMWKWGVIVFINSYFFWFLMTMIHGRILHLEYLKCFFFFENRFQLTKGRTYDFKLTVVGHQFTSSKGSFVLNEPGTGEIFSFPIQVEFPKADYDKIKVSSVVLRGTFTAKQNHKNVYFDFVWPDEFRMYEMRVPAVKVEFRRHIPWVAKTRWNIFFFPVFFLLHITLGPRSSYFQNYRTYLALVLFFACAHGTWILMIVFTTLSLVPWTDEAATSWFWGTLDERPPVPIIAFAMFGTMMLLNVLLSILIRLNVSRVLRKKPTISSQHHSHSSASSEAALEIESSDDEFAVHDDKGDSLMTSRTTGYYDNLAENDVDLMNVEFVALKDFREGNFASSPGGAFGSFETRRSRFSGSEVETDHNLESSSPRPYTSLYSGPSPSLSRPTISSFDHVSSPQPIASSLDVMASLKEARSIPFFM